MTSPAELSKVAEPWKCLCSLGFAATTGGRAVYNGGASGSVPLVFKTPSVGRTIETIVARSGAFIWLEVGYVASTPVWGYSISRDTFFEEFREILGRCP
jgi:hypothetical protein